MIEVVCAVIEREGRFLACQRPHGKCEGGKWEFPGGKIEEGESAEAALIREIDEELGCAIIVGKEMISVYHENICLRPFRVEMVEEPELKEHLAMRWLRRSEFGELDWAAADIPILKQL